MKEKYMPPQVSGRVKEIGGAGHVGAWSVEMFKDFQKSIDIHGTWIRGRVEAGEDRLSLKYGLEIQQGGETTRITKKRFVVTEETAMEVRQSVVALAERGYSIDAIAKKLNLEEEKVK